MHKDDRGFLIRILDDMIMHFKGKGSFEFTYKFVKELSKRYSDYMSSSLAYGVFEDKEANNKVLMLIVLFDRILKLIYEIEE